MVDRKVLELEKKFSEFCDSLSGIDLTPEQKEKQSEIRNFLSEEVSDIVMEYEDDNEGLSFKDWIERY